MHRHRKRHYGYAKHRHQELAGFLVAGGSEVEQALIKDGGAWTIDTGFPDGYFRQDGGKLVIDESLNSGIDFVLNGALIVNT